MRRSKNLPGVIILLLGFAQPLFAAAPSITGLNLGSGPVGTSVTLSGTNFGSPQGTSTVTFNGTAGTPTSWSTTSIAVPVPSGASTGNIIVTVGGVPSNPASFIVTPHISGVSPTATGAGMPVTISGTNFGSSQGTSAVTFSNGQSTATPTSWSDTSITTPVPFGAITDQINVQVGGYWSNSINFTVLPTPTVTSMSPSSGPIGTWVTITGSNLGSSQGSSTITFNGVTATTITSWTSTSIVVAVPAGTTTGNIVITVNGVPSAGSLFTEFATAPIPQVVQVQPATAATAVPLNGRVVVRFAQPVPPVSVVNGILTLRQGSTNIAGTVSQSNDGLSLTFTPTQNLAASTSYTFSVQDIGAGQTTPQFQSTFTTGTTTDTTAPKVVQLSPPASATGVPINAPLVVQFSKPMDPSTITPQLLAVTDAGVNVAGIVQVDPTGLTASFVPSQFPGVGHNISSASFGSNTSIRDTSGNGLTGGGSFGFTTSFSSDTQGPSLVATSPASGVSAVPLNALIVLEFSKPLDVISVSKGFEVLSGGNVVTGGIALSDSNKRITFTPSSALAANTAYTVVTTSQITDVGGFAMLNPGSSTFTTGSASDTTTPSVTATSPSSGAVGVPTNAVLQLLFSKPVNPITVTSTTVLFSPGASSSILLPGTITVSADAKTASFVPSSPLLADTAYSLRATTGITDLEGHTLSGGTTWSFTTGTSASTSGPTVMSISPENGVIGVSVNTKIDVVASVALSPASVGSSSITVSAGGTAVSGSVTLGSSGTTLTFTPAALLATNTQYSVTVGVVTDQAGNVITPSTTTFTTGSSSTADTTKPSVTAVSPTNAATGVSVNAPIILTFNEGIDFSTVSNSSIVVYGPFSGVLAGVYSINSTGTAVTFTPVSPLPGNTTFTVRVGYNSYPTDLAGNTANSFSSYFTTAATPDTTPPSVVSVTPASGATNMGLNAKPVITFSESLNASTLTSSNLGLFANGTQVSAGVSSSADNRVVTLSPSILPAASNVDIVATSGVKDLSGNSLPYFVSQFTTANQFDFSSPSVSVQRPANGASNVPLTSNIVIYINEPMVVTSVQNALHVSQNGVLVSGTTQVTDNGQVIQFTPSVPWQYNAQIQVFVDSTALDTDGIALNSYQGSFRTVTDTSASAPTVVATNPGLGVTAPTNVVVEVGFSQPIDPASVTGTSVVCFREFVGGWIQGYVGLLYGGQVLQFIPRYPLAPNTSYQCVISSNLRGANGVAFYGTNVIFTTGSVADTTVPTLVSISPPSGSTNVGDNGLVRLVFSKPINPLTINSSTVQLSGGGTVAILDSISFSNNNQSVLLTPHAPFPDSTQMTIALNGIADVVGNPVAAQTTQFATGSGPDLVRPLAVNTNPAANAVGVPLNAVFIAQMNEPMDPGAVNTTNVTLSTSGQNVPGSVALSADGQTITFLPSAPLAPNTIYSFHFLSSIADLAGNLGTQNGTPGDFSVTTGSATSTNAPQVTGISPANGATAIPTNAQVMINFNEPVDGARLNGVTISAGGSATPVSQVLSNGNQTLILIPTLPLSPTTAYTVTISGVQDLSGNVMASPVTVTFTTSAGANLVAPSVVSATPTGFSVPINNTVVHVTLAYPINPLTISSATFQLYPSTTHIPVAGTISISADGVTLTFTPSQTLDPSTTYVINLTGGDLDPEGRSLSWSAQFTTVSGSAGLSPVILSLNNTSAAPGTLIAVNGMYFGTSQGTSTITFNGTVPTLYSWSDSQIYAYVPTGATSGRLLVTVNGIASNSIVFNVQQTPTITSISPTSGAAGTVITINGTSFGNSYDPAPQVLGAPFTVTATSWTQTSLQAVIPLSAYPEVQSLTVKQNTRSSSAVNFTVVGTPGISSLSPTSGAPGTPVTINGSNFGSTQGSSTVTFNGVPAASITTWGTSSITAVPPSNVTTGPINVTVNSINSNPTQTFTVTTPAIGNLSPPAAAVGALVNINGSGFYSQGLTTQVYLNGVQVPIAYWGGNPTYPSMGTNQLTVRVPTGATSGNLTVVIGSVTSNAVAFTVEAPPSVTAITPTQGQIGDTVLITGSGFGATQSSSTISFYPGNNAQVVDWSDTAIHVIVPGGTSTGVFNVQVATLTSQGPSFQITNTTQVTDSLGNQSTYATAINAGSWTLSSSSGPGCSSCSVRGNITETVDAKGNVLTHTDDLGHVTTYTYDSNNSVTSVSQQLDANTTVRTSYTYNSFGEALTMTDPLGNVTTNAYDAKGNLTSVTSPAPDSHTPASVTQFAYNTLGELTQLTDPLDHPTTLTYTPAGLIASITDAQNNTTSYQYDQRGNRTTVIDPINGASHPTTFTYDIMNRLTGITYPDGSAVSFGYDSRGRRTSVTDQNGKVTTYAHDDDDRLISVTDPANNLTTYNYDTEDNLASITDANNHITNFAYNARGWVTQTTFPSTLYETYAYDAGGNLTSKTDRKNQTIQYVYDALNRLATKTYPDSTSASYVYDLVSKIKQVTDPTGTYGFAYDNMGRLVGTTTQYTFVPNQTFTNAYTYDAASNRTSLTAPDGSVTTYGYDTLNRLNGLANSWAGSFGFGYDSLSRRTSLTRPNGVNTSYTYDSVSHLLSVLHQAGSSVLDGASYTYDNAGNRTGKTNYLNGLTSNYTYDSLYELTQVTQGGSTTESYSYDAMGNRLNSLGVASYSYNASNELTSSSLGSYTYDANGNTLSDAQGRSFTWDFENRLFAPAERAASGREHSSGWRQLHLRCCRKPHEQKQ